MGVVVLCAGFRLSSPPSPLAHTSAGVPKWYVFGGSAAPQSNIIWCAMLRCFYIRFVLALWLVLFLFCVVHCFWHAVSPSPPCFFPYIKIFFFARMPLLLLLGFLNIVCTFFVCSFASFFSSLHPSITHADAHVRRCRRACVLKKESRARGGEEKWGILGEAAVFCCWGEVKQIGVGGGRGGRGVGGFC